MSIRSARGLGPPKRANAREGGFTLIEMLISAGIMLTVTGALFQLMHPAHGTFKAQPEMVDLQQRLRVAVDSLSKDLIMAGAGTYSGSTVGPLTGYFAPVMPYRIGDKSDPQSGVFYRQDAITLIYVPQTPSQATIRDEIPKTARELIVEVQPNCPPNRANQICGFRKGMRAILFDVNGPWDPITISDAEDETVYLQYEGELQVAYSSGSSLAAVAMHTYYLKTDTGRKTYQLMHADGAGRDLPMVDDVVKLEFQYFGDPQPPTRLLDKPLTSTTGPWTTYGPRPPELGQAGPFAWPVGENCTFTVDNDAHVPRLAVLEGGVSLVELDPAILTDGPWCPDANASEPFDADLLRIRRVRVTLRVQVATESLRGQGELFMRPGTSIGGERYVQDQEVRFDIAPRNMNLSR